MKKPPCKVNGVECDKRYIGCHADCEAYHEWLAVHAAEKQARYRYYEKTADADSLTTETRQRFCKRNKAIKKKVGQK